jgi:hypothetical protein
MLFELMLIFTFFLLNMSWQRVEAILNSVNSTIRRVSALVDSNAQDVFELRAKVDMYEDDLEEIHSALLLLARSNERLARVCAHHMSRDGAEAVAKEVVKQGEAISNISRVLHRDESGGESDEEIKGVALVSE